MKELMSERLFKQLSNVHEIITTKWDYIDNRLGPLIEHSNDLARLLCVCYKAEKDLEIEKNKKETE